MLTHALLLPLLFLGAPALAAPFDEPSLGITACVYPFDFTITSQTQIDDTPHLITGVQAGPDPAGCSIAAGHTYSVAVRYTGGVPGIDLGRQQIFNWGASPSANISFFDTASASSAQACPPNVRCGLTASARLLKVDGTMAQVVCNSDYESIPCDAWASCKEGLPADFGTPAPFTAYFPVTAESQGPAIVTFRACSIGQQVIGMDVCPDSSSDA